MSDGQYEEDTRRWLSSVEVPPPRLDVGRMVGLARDRARRRRWYAAGSAAVAVLAAAATVPAAVQAWPQTAPAVDASAASASPDVAAEPVACTASVLDPPSGLAERGVLDPAAVSVAAMDPTGRYVVGDTYGGRNDSPATVLWDRGTPTVLPTDRGHVVSEAVNSRGEVAGYGARGNEDPYAWVYRDGEVRELPMPAGYHDIYPAMDINEDGDVVGNVQDAEHAIAVVVWPAEDVARPRVLAPPPGEQVAAVAITDDGTVVGNVSGATGSYVWDPDGTGRALPLPEDASSGGVAAVRGHWAVGWASRAATPAEIEARAAGGVAEPGKATLPVPVRWDLRTGAGGEIPGYQDSGAVPVNGSGFGADAVNRTGDAVVGYPGPQVLRRDGREVTLPVPVEDASPDPVAISDDRTRVAGNVVADNGDEGEEARDAPGGSGTPPGEPSDLPRPVVWDC